jgi:hypothetical protein
MKREPRTATANLEMTAASIEYQNNAVIFETGGVIGNRITAPLPTGSYFTRLVSLCRENLDSDPHDPLLSMLMNVDLIGRKVYDKEITEVFGVAAGVEKAVRYICGRPADTLYGASFYVVGDGTLPLSAAAIRLALESSARTCRARNEKHLENRTELQKELDSTTEKARSADGQRAVLSWRFHSIDPALLECSECEALSAIQQSEKYRASFKMWKTRSQDFDLPSDQSVSTHTEQSGIAAKISFVIACHSHAPLEEFWARVPSPKVAVVMPCCGRDWSSLTSAGRPVFEYDDFDVFSTRRRIKIYASGFSILPR